MRNSSFRATASAGEIGSSDNLWNQALGHFVLTHRLVVLLFRNYVKGWEFSVVLVLNMKKGEGSYWKVRESNKFNMFVWACLSFGKPPLA